MMNVEYAGSAHGFIRLTVHIYQALLTKQNNIQTTVAFKAHVW